MANRIGIKVDVAFPSGAELRRELEKAWSQVNTNLEADVKLNVSEASMKDLKKSIQTALNLDKYEININSKEALKSVKSLVTQIKSLDKLINIERKITVDIDADKLKGSMGDVLKEMHKIESQARNGMADGMKEYNNQLKEADKNLSKLAHKTKTKNGALVNVTETTTSKDGVGGTKNVKVSTNADGSIIKDIENIHNKETALKNVKAQAEKVAKAEKDMHKASLDGDAELLAHIKKRFDIENQELDSLKNQYRQTYGQADKDLRKTISNVRAKLSAEKKAMDIISQTAEKNKTIQDDIKRIVELERKRILLQKDMVGATDEQRANIQQLDNSYKSMIDNIKKRVNFEEQATREQKEGLQHLREMTDAQIRMAEATRKTSQLQEKDAQNLRVMKDKYGEILALKQRIASVSGQQNKDGAHSELESLKRALAVQEDIYSKVKQQIDAEGRINNELNEQEKNLRAGHNIKMSQIQADNKIRANQEKANELLQRYMDSLRRIGQLQRDLVFAGDRESNIIRNALKEEQQKLQTMRQEISASDKITDARKKEIVAIEKAQREQEKLNNIRREAREVDRVYDNAYGVTDFQSVLSNYTQGFREILDSMALVDEAYMRVKKVANQTEETMNNFKSGSYDTASNLGVTSPEYMMAVEKWITSGYNMKDSEELAQISTVGAFVGNVEADLMAKWLSVPLNAYQHAGVNSRDIINAMNETANNYAIEMEELGKGYMRSAGASKTAGVTFQELTGLITGAQEATRMGGERIGTGFKTISGNYLKIKSAETAGEKTKQSRFTDVGIDITKTKSLTELLDKVSDKWAGLDDTQRNRIILALAGAEHSNVLTGTLNEWGTVERASEGADIQLGLGERGSAYKEFAEQKDSVRFQLAELKNAWLEFTNTIGESDGMVKNVLSFLTDSLKKASELAQNEELMEVLKLIAIGIGFHAGTNGMMRVFDILGTGLRNTTKDLDKFFGLFVKNEKTLSAVYQNRRNGDGSVLITGSNSNNGANNGGNGGNGGNSGSIITTGGLNAGANNGGSNGGTQRTLVRSSLHSGSVQLGADGANVIRQQQQRQQERELQQQSDEQGRRMGTITSTVGSAAKTVFKMLPIVGDALLIAEFMGADVFGKIGSLFKKVTKDSQDIVRESQEAIEQLELTNDTTNGNLNTVRATVSVGDSSYKSVVGDVKEGKDINTEDFMELKEYINNAIVDMGLQKYAEEGIELGIKWNNPEEVKQGIEDFEKALKSYGYEESRKLGEGYIKEIKDLQGEKEKAEKALGIGTGLEAMKTKQYKDEKKRLEDLLKERKRLLDDSEKGTREHKTYSKMVENTENELKALKEARKTSKEIIKDVDETYEKVGQTLINLKPEDLTSALKGLSDSELSSVLEAMKIALEKNNEQLSEYKELQALTQKETALTSDEFDRLIGAVALLDEDLASKTGYNAYKNNVGGAKDKVSELIQMLLDGQIEITKTGKLALVKGQEIADGLNKGKVGAEQALTSLSLFRNQWDLLSDKKINLTVSSNNTGSTSNSPRLSDHVTTPKFNGSPRLSDHKTVSTNPVSVGTKGLVSASVSTGGTTVSNATSTKKSTSTKKKTSTKKEEKVDDSKVDEAVWRYWKTENKQSALERVMQDLTRAIENNSRNYKKLDSLYSQQISNLNSQKATKNTLIGAKQSEAKSVISQLSKYGFKSNGYNITNLDRAKSLTGESATKAQELLTTWQTVYNELGSIKQEIADIDSQIKDIKITKELNNFQKSLDNIDKLMKTVQNRNGLNDLFTSLIDSKDFDLRIMGETKNMQTRENYAKQLIAQFNTLSTKTVSYEENAEVLLTTLEALKGEIMNNAEAVYEHIKAVNDLEITRATEDVDELSQAFERLQGNISNTRDNVSEGLLSGTKLGDLQSTKNSSLQLVDDNMLDGYAKTIISMENQLQVALDNYATKNVERTASVANANLKINEKMYNTLLNFAGTFNNGKRIEGFSSILEGLTKKSTVDVAYTLDSELTKLYDTLYKKQIALDKKYQSKLSSKNYDERLEAQYQYSLESIALENDINEYRIKASKETIKEYSRQLKDNSLTESQAENLKTLIKAEEDAIISLQNSIKENVATLYETQLNQIDLMVDKYDDYISRLEYSLSILSAVNPSNLQGQLDIMDGINRAQGEKMSQAQSNLSLVEYEMSLLEKGSYEWNILNEKVSEYNSTVQESASAIIDMNNQIRDMKIDDVVSNFEKALFGGKTAERFKEFKDMWLTGLEKELALEEMYQKINEIETTNFDAKMALLDKQEKISRLEADYLNKQIDIYKLQQELENSREQRSVKTLQQNDDGSFQWNYVADTDEAELSKKIKKAQIELEGMEDQAKSSYISDLERIASRISSGEYSSVDEIDKDLANIAEAYNLIVGEMPDELKGMEEAIKEAYLTGNVGNGSIIEQLTTTPVQKTVDRLKDSMVSELQNLGDRIEKAIASTLSGAIGTTIGLKSNNVSTRNDTANSITIDKLEFPNATSSDEIRNALINLPQYAMQYANAKK